MKRRNILRVLAIAIAVVMVSCFTGCRKQGLDEVLIDAALDEASVMKEAVCSETYRKIVSSGIDCSDMIDTVSGEDVKTVKAVYEISVDPLELVKLLSSAETDAIDQMSDKLRARLINNAYASLPSYINARQGTTAIAFMSMFNSGGNMICKSLESRRILILVFDSGYPVWATFSPGENNIVSYSTSWIIADCARITSSDTLQAELGFENLSGLKITKIR